MIDKQVREALIEYQCRCLRMDKVKIPFIGGLLSTIHRPLGYFPKFHMVAARVGYGASTVVAERWSYLGKDLHAAYDTRQVFRSDYPDGPHTVLPPWDFQPPKPFMARMREKLQQARATPAKPAPKPPAPVTQALQALPADERLKLAARYWRNFDQTRMA